MKTADILMIAAGVGIVGYLVYKNKNQLAPKPLTDSDNEPLRADTDLTQYKTEEEKPASDPVVLSSQTKFVAEVPVKNAVVKTDDDYTTGEQPSVGLPVLKEITPIPEFNTTTPYSESPVATKPLVAFVSPSAPVVSITDKPEQYPTVLYNNSERNIKQETYDFGLAY